LKQRQQGQNMITHLLAWQGSIENMSTHFRSGSERAGILPVVILVLILAAAGVGIWLLSRYVNRKYQGGYANPRALFNALCTAHNLDYNGRRVLKRLAKFHGFAQPARIFLEPGRFESKNVAAAMNEDPEIIENLRDHIFGRELQASL